MNIYAIICLFVAAILLWFPRGWLRLGARLTPKPPRKYNQSKVERDIYDNSVKPLAEAAKPRNWIDLARGAIGAVTVVYTLQELLGTTESKGAVLYSSVGMLLVGVGIQMIRLEGRLSLFAPIFFLQGMAIGLIGPLAGLLAMVGTWAFSPVLPNSSAVLFVQGGLAVCLALLLPDSDMDLALVVGALTWLPVLTAILTQRRLAATFDKKMKVIPRG
ncbi:MAG: hypothetical protein NTU80_12355 [Verrucomicrobia bacterium]|nr:hypothetical protein [Verrucomicrobiota bacterium]